MKHRGRIQAQGRNLEASESWSQNNPITKTEGMTMLEKLKNKIPNIEAKIRERVFLKAQKFINQGPHEVVNSPIKRSFKVSGTKSERVDIEIQKGEAFI